MDANQNENPGSALIDRGQDEDESNQIQQEQMAEQQHQRCPRDSTPDSGDEAEDVWRLHQDSDK